MQMNFDPKTIEESGITGQSAEALDAMDQGFLWLDANHVVKQHNRAYRRLLELDGADCFIGRPYSELFKYLLERGEFTDCEDHESFMAERMRSMRNQEQRNLDIKAHARQATTQPRIARTSF